MSFTFKADQLGLGGRFVSLLEGLTLDNKCKGETASEHSQVFPFEKASPVVGSIVVDTTV